MITLYGILKSLHVIGAAVWLGSNATTLALRAIALRTGEGVRRLALIRETDRVQMLLVSPAVGLLLGTGIWLVEEGGWGFHPFFVIFGLSGIAASGLLGSIITLPPLRKLRRAAEGRGVTARELGSLIRRLQLGLAVDLLLVVAVVFVMVTKPTL